MRMDNGTEGMNVGRQKGMVKNVGMLSKTHDEAEEKGATRNEG